MKRLLLFFALILVIPQVSHAANGRVFEKWLLRTGDDIDAWNGVGTESVELTSEGMTFDVAEEVVFYRKLPEGFHKHVDGIRVRYNATGLDEVSLQLVRPDETGGIGKRFSLQFPVRKGLVTEYVPLQFYPKDIAGMEYIAMSFKGNAQNISLDSVRFLQYTTREKIIGAWISFWKLQPFTPFSINIILGPTITTDRGPYEDFTMWRQLSVSVNAYLMVGFSLFGCALLLYGVWLTHKRHVAWEEVQRIILRRFFLVIAVVWLLYDARMGAEYLRNVYTDHTQYVFAKEGERTFRDIGDFYDFVAFAKPFVADRNDYEVLLAEEWPFFGILRYETYPHAPNPGAPLHDTWVIYNRSDIAVSDTGELMFDGSPITGPGEILGQFNKRSFIFRELEVNEVSHAEEETFHGMAASGQNIFSVKEFNCSSCGHSMKGNRLEVRVLETVFPKIFLSIFPYFEMIPPPFFGGIATKKSRYEDENVMTVVPQRTGELPPQYDSVLRSYFFASL